MCNLHQAAFAKLAPMKVATTLLKREECVEGTERKFRQNLSDNPQIIRHPQRSQMCHLHKAAFALADMKVATTLLKREQPVENMGRIPINFAIKRVAQT